MADTSTTKYPVPSANPDVLEFNAKAMDEFITSSSARFQDRGGVNRLTIHGASAKLAESAGTYAGIYENGTVISTEFDFAVYASDGSRWKVANPENLPYTIDATTYPDPADDPILRIYAETSHLKAIALSNNTAVSDVAYLVNGATYTGQRYFHDSATQVTYFIAGGLTGTVTAVSSDSDGEITVTISSVYYTTKNVDLKKDAVCQTYAEAKALTGLIPGQKVTITDALRGGSFTVRDVANYSAEIALDPDEGFYVTTDDGLYVIVRDTEGYGTFEMFGISVDSSTDCRQAIETMSALGLTVHSRAKSGMYYTTTATVSDNTWFTSNGSFIGGTDYTTDLFSCEGSVLGYKAKFKLARAVFNMCSAVEGSDHKMIDCDFVDVAYGLFARPLVGVTEGYEPVDFGILKIADSRYSGTEVCGYSIFKKWSDVAIDNNTCTDMQLRDIGDRTVLPYIRHNVGGFLIGSTFSPTTTDELPGGRMSGNTIKDVYNSLIDPYTGLPPEDLLNQETHALDFRCTAGHGLVIGNNIENVTASEVNIDVEGIVLRAKSGLIGSNDLINAGQEEAAISCKWEFEDNLLVTGNNVSWPDDATQTNRRAFLCNSQTGKIVYEGGVIKNATRAISWRFANGTVKGVNFKNCDRCYFLAPDFDVESISLFDNEYEDCEELFEHLRDVSSRFGYAVQSFTARDKRAHNLTALGYSIPATAKVEIHDLAITSDDPTSLRVINLYDPVTPITAPINIMRLAASDMGGGDGRFVNTVGGSGGFVGQIVNMIGNTCSDAYIFASFYNRDYDIVRAYNNVDINSATSYTFGTCVNDQQQNISV